MVQVVKMTDEEKFEMYMKVPHEELVRMKIEEEKVLDDVTEKLNALELEKIQRDIEHRESLRNTFYYEDPYKDMKVVERCGNGYSIRVKTEKDEEENTDDWTTRLFPSSTTKHNWTRLDDEIRMFRIPLDDETTIY